VDSSDLDSWYQAKIEPHLFSQSRLSLLDESGYSVEVQRAAHEGTSLVIQVKVKNKSTTDDLTLSSGLLSLYGFLSSDGRLVGAHSQRNSPIVEANFEYKDSPVIPPGFEDTAIASLPFFAPSTARYAVISIKLPGSGAVRGGIWLLDLR
jgi:hypothetical protein